MAQHSPAVAGCHSADWLVHDDDDDDDGQAASIDYPAAAGEIVLPRWKLFTLT